MKIIKVKKTDDSFNSELYAMIPKIERALKEDKERLTPELHGDFDEWEKRDYQEGMKFLKAYSDLGQKILKEADEMIDLYEYISGMYS